MICRAMLRSLLRSRRQSLALPVLGAFAALAAAGCGASQGASPPPGYQAAVALVLAAPPGTFRLAPVPDLATTLLAAARPVIPRFSARTPVRVASVDAGELAADLDQLARGKSAVAWAEGRPIAVYRSPRAGHAERRFPVRNPFGLTQVFLVKRAVPGWLEVYLPARPNNSTGWVRTARVGLTVNPYRIVINTTGHELITLRAGRPVMRTAVGVGKSATPTPHGSFFVVDELKMVPASGAYGPYAFGLSAHSTVLKTFGTGDAQIAIHGTDEPASIGQNWSNGCIHMSNSVAEWLARTLPLGTPVQII